MFGCEFHPINTFTAILDINRKCISPGVFPLALLMAGEILNVQGRYVCLRFHYYFKFFLYLVLCIYYLQCSIIFLQKKWRLEKK